MNKRSAPAYSMSGKPKQNFRQTSPGPAAYDKKQFPNQISSPSHRMATSKRDFKYENQIPGPGNYVTGGKEKFGVNIVMAHKPKDVPPQKVPGPGSYNPNYQIMKKKLPKWGIKERSFNKNMLQMKKVPGPGQYNVQFNSTVKSMGNVLFDHSRRLDRKTVAQNTPGPGSYNAELGKKYVETDKEISFGKQIRCNTEAANTPGPGQYKLASDLEQSTRKLKGYQIGSRTKCKTQVDTPGPAAYDSLGSSSRIKKSPSYSLQRASRTLDKQDKKPAPGQYNPNYNSFKTIGGVVARSERNKLEKQKVNVPGPGSYKVPVKMTKEGRQYSFTKCRFQQQKNSNPGPEYDPKPIYESRFASVSIGYGNRDSFFGGNKNPGPGSYKNNKFETIQSSKSGCKIGNQKRGSTKDQHYPGPGQYSIPSYVSNLPSFANSKTMDMK